MIKVYKAASNERCLLGLLLMAALLGMTVPTSLQAEENCRGAKLLINQASTLQSQSDPQFDKVAKLYEEAFRLCPSLHEAYETQFNYGVVLERMGKLEESLQTLERARQIKDDAETNTALGQVAVKLEQYDEASSYFQRALSLNPESEQAKKGSQLVSKRLVKSGAE